MLNHRIKLLKRAAGTDSVGQLSKDWVKFAERWANVQFQSGAEVVRAGAEVSVVKASIRIRACRDVDAGMRVVYGRWTFSVQAPPLPDKDPQFVFLVCEAVK